MRRALTSASDATARWNWKRLVQRLQGSTIDTDLSRYAAPLRAINELESECRGLSDESLLARCRDVQCRVRAGEARDPLRVTFFALAREAADRALGQRPFDVQIVAALALDDGRVVEMLTGEGKTLTAVLPAAMHAMAGAGVHVLTFNDYLARRDAEWMGPVYERLGLSVGYVQQGLLQAERREAYRQDVTYVTAKEAGFDHLRDLLVTDPADLVHRPFNVALVDEADSIMIDEARVPLVIAGSTDGDSSRAPQLAALVASLTPGLHFDGDEDGRDIELTDAGLDLVERQLRCGSLHDSANLPLLTALGCALHARALLRRDVDYIVRNGRIEIVDEFTGRVVPDRHWPDGLQAALEAKEGLARQADGLILGSLTVRGFLRGYRHLCGMTGTARACAEELQHAYGLDVVVVPTHRAVCRDDRDDVVFTHAEAKQRAIVDEIRRTHAAGRPVLVGTSSIVESEALAGRLRASGIACVVLNARNDVEEAAIVARAGARGAVTISTNMAGRGTDIRLGGSDGSGHAEVAALGGLYVIGTALHESSRVDRQLRGRAGRQGDPGESRFFISLDDELLVRFGIGALIPARSLPEKSDAAIESPIVRREVARAQRIIEGQNFEIRKTLARYTVVLEEQHRLILERRREVLFGERPLEVWCEDASRRAILVAAAGEDAVVAAERAVTLACIDRAWRDHLALCADVREGIHLVRLGGRDPLTDFTRAMIEAFSEIDVAIDAAVLAALPLVRIDGSQLDLTAAGIKGPSSTWTYLINDDPFKNRITAMLTGMGGATVAIYAASVMMPLLIAWGLVETLLGRRPRRRAGPFSR